MFSLEAAVSSCHMCTLFYAFSELYDRDAEGAARFVKVALQAAQVCAI